MAEINDSEETELVSREQGKELAEAWLLKPQKLEIPDTLLNSKDITTVVQATGLISPFYHRGGRKSRLKKAAYEGRVGSKAFIFREMNSPEQIFDSAKDEYLHVPKNSIVFVESDLDFRLPDFIALRFNLQIQHVHRGLLLGTGPLVDPGFWGKLCIPLHNLTDQDYDIPKKEGLIWLEFTKTTLPPEQTDDARVPLEGTPHDEKGNWDIGKFLDKAASQYRGHKVPIKSSLPTMFAEANAAAKRSADDASAALKSAEGLRSLNTIALVAAGVALCAICLAATTFIMNLSSRNEDIVGRLTNDTEAVQRSIEQHVKDVDQYGNLPVEARASVPALRGKLDEQRREIDALEEQVGILKSHINNIERSRNNTGSNAIKP